MITPDTQDLEYLNRVRRKYSNYPIIGYMNVNSPRSKIIDLRHVISAKNTRHYQCSRSQCLMIFLMLISRLMVSVILNNLGGIELALGEVCCL